jgi:hypothetical protein
MKITKGKRSIAKRVVIHGVEGIGKSTLASQFPKPLVLDTEDGTNHLDVDRVTITNYLEAEGTMHELLRDSQGYQTLVVDSGDWLERMAIEHMLAKAQKRSIEDFGFGKGYTMVAEAMGRFLTVCDSLVERGINVVIVCHTTVKRCSPPDMDEGYDRFELKLTKQSGPLVKEWADCILFANYKTRLVAGEDGRTRAKGGKERVLHTERTAAFDAKNRYGLAAELPMTIEALAPLFANVTPAKPGWGDRVKTAASVEDLGVIESDADDAVTAGDLTESQRNTLGTAISKRRGVLSPEEVPA